MLRAFCTSQLFAAINKPQSTSYSTAAAKALNLFICATDVSSDKVAAALVASLKQLHAHGLNVYGVVRLCHNLLSTYVRFSFH